MVEGASDFTLYIKSMFKLQTCKKRNKTGNENGLNLVKKTKKEHNDSALGLGAGKGTKIGDHLHTSKKN